MLRLPHARGLLCGIDDAAERSQFNSDTSRLLRVPAWGAKCFQVRLTLYTPNPNPNPNPNPDPNPTVTLTLTRTLFQPCSSELAKWLSPEQISSGGGSHGNFWTLHVKPPPPFKAGACVRNLHD